MFLFQNKKNIYTSQMSDDDEYSDYDYEDGFVVKDDEPIDYYSDEFESEEEASDPYDGISEVNIVEGKRTRRTVDKSSYLRNKLVEEGILDEYEEDSGSYSDLEELEEFEEYTDDDEEFELVEDDDDSSYEEEIIEVYIDDDEDYEEEDLEEYTEEELEENDNDELPENTRNDNTPATSEPNNENTNDDEETVTPEPVS